MSTGTFVRPAAPDPRPHGIQRPRMPSVSAQFSVTVRVELESQGKKALFCGDILHHAVQVYHPEWNSFACLDQDNARKSRRAAIEHCAGTGAMLLPCHFGAPFHCHIDHKGAGFAPRFANNF